MSFPVDHPAAHRDPVLLGDVAAEADEVEGGEAPHGHGQVDASTGNMLQVTDVCKVLKGNPELCRCDKQVVIFQAGLPSLPS